MLYNEPCNTFRTLQRTAFLLFVLEGLLTTTSILDLEYESEYPKHYSTLIIYMVNMSSVTFLEFSWITRTTDLCPTTVHLKVVLEAIK